MFHKSYKLELRQLKKCFILLAAATIMLVLAAYCDIESMDFELEWASFQSWIYMCISFS